MSYLGLNSEQQAFVDYVKSEFGTKSSGTEETDADNDLSNILSTSTTNPSFLQDLFNSFNETDACILKKLILEVLKKAQDRLINQEISEQVAAITINGFAQGLEQSETKDKIQRINQLKQQAQEHLE